MKSITKKIAVLLLVCVMVFSFVALVACKDKNTYTVKVIDANGKPYTSALVQLCEVGPDGKLATCYAGVATDDKGVATLKIGNEITNTDANEMEVHLLNLPPYLTFEKNVRMKKGDTATIKVIDNAPESGRGTGGYTTMLGDTVFDMESFDPYVVREGAYKFKFTSAEQKIYYEFRTEDEGVYKIYSVGNVDASVNQLVGTKTTGVRNTGDAEFTNDNVSATDKNFSYNFEVSPSLIEQTKALDPDNINYGACFFEISLENASDVNKEAYVYFEYVDDYVGKQLPPTTDITPEKALAEFAEYNGSVYAFVDAELDGNFTYVMGSDGYYHVGTADGPILVANLGKDPALNDKHDSIGNAPRGYELGFTVLRNGADGVEAFQPLVVSDGETYAYDYYPLVEAYTMKSNSDGRYGVTEELKNFLDQFINHISGTKNWVENDPDIGHLPDGDEWLWACGYYKEHDGTLDDPYMFNFGEYQVNVPANGEVYFTLDAYVSMTMVITSTSTNASVKFYQSNSVEDATVVSSTNSGLTCTVDVTGDRNEASTYYFVFSTKDNSAGSYTINVDTPKGTSENPIVIEAFGTFNTYVNEIQGMFGSDIDEIYYSYTVKASDTKLYFAWGDNTAIEVIVGFSYIQSIDSDDAAKLTNGVDVSNMVGKTITIKVKTANAKAGDASFTISNSAIAN